MDNRGFLSPHDCKRCGVPLQGMGEGRPAELYLATHTGYCYPCNDRPPELLYTKKLDGAQVWEYPPHSPAWRRGRETYTGYADCARCGGRGVTNYPIGYGTPYVSCDDCLARYDAHELRRRYDAGCRTIYNLATERMRGRVYALAGVNVHTPRKVRDAACAKVPAGNVEAAAAESWDWYRTQLHGLEAAARARGTFD